MITTALFISALVVIMIPFFVWFSVNYQKSRYGEVSFKHKQVHKWSWIISGIVFIMLFIAGIISFIA